MDIYEDFKVTPRNEGEEIARELAIKKKKKKAALIKFLRILCFNQINEIWKDSLICFGSHYFILCAVWNLCNFSYRINYREYSS